MFNEIIVNVHPYETRVAILEDNRLVELFVEKREQQNIVGNIYKGYVQDVLPGMGAAFINIGLERTAFLHYSDIVTDFFDLVDSDNSAPSKLAKDSSKIGKYLKEGQEIVVQVQKGPLGKKGARLTGQISLPGKFLVFFPNKNRVAVSRKINTYAEKNRIKTIISQIKHKDIGLIVRTDAEGNSLEEFETEYNGLYKTWKYLEKQIQYAKPPVCIFNQSDLTNTLIRDLFNTKIDRLVVDDRAFRERLIQNLQLGAPELVERIELYKEDSPIFDAYGIEKEIEKMFNARVELPSGGNIVIEQTEAMVSIDINTGSYTGRRNYEDTIRQTNVEAAEEIARQIRLRDLSGIMVIDFIDMESESSKSQVLDTLRRCLKRDRARNKVFPFGPLGLVEITRKRTRPNIILAYSERCPCCHGAGRIISRDSVAMKIFRWISRSEYFLKDKPLQILVAPPVKEYLDNNPEYLSHVKNKLEITVDDEIALDGFRVLDLQTGKEITTHFKAH